MGVKWQCCFFPAALGDGPTAVTSRPQMARKGIPSFLHLFANPSTPPPPQRGGSFRAADLRGACNLLSLDFDRHIFAWFLLKRCLSLFFDFSSFFLRLILLGV